MRYLREFAKFESVIIPSKLEGDVDIKSFDSLVDYGQRNNFDVVEYDEFYNSLGEGDKKTAPPKEAPFFALFHPIRKKPMFVLSNKNSHILKNMKEIVDDIIGHERIHAEQSNRKGDIEYSLPSPLDKKEYLSNKEEIMAFSWTIANDLSRIGNLKDALIQFKTNRISGSGGFIWMDIRRNCDDDVINRYRKYIYMYLQKMFPDESDNINTKINRK